MPRFAVFCVILLAFVAKLATHADKPAQNITKVSEQLLSVVSDNFCNNNEKNVAFDVIVIDSKATAVSDTSHLRKRHASSRRDFRDRPRADQKSLLLVFDGTGSMHDDLVQLKGGAEEIINEFSNRDDSPIFNYVLVVFRDPSVEPPFETRNPEELLEKLKYVDVKGGGDCPEKALSGLRIALRLALPNSLAYVFSDASALDYYLYGEVVELIQAKQVTVNFLLTGYCDNQTSPEYQTYHRLSRVSNGQVYDMKKNNVKDVLLAIRHTVSHSYAALKSVDVVNAGTSNTDLSVDKSITKLSVSITGENPTLSIRNPSNETVESRDSLTLKNLKLVNIEDPNEGVWRIEAKADSSHSIRLSALSDLKLEFGFSLSDVEKQSETSYQPLLDQKNVLTIFVSDPSLVNELSNVTILLVPPNPSERSIKYTIPLRRQTENQYATRAFDVPRQMFKIQLNGIDAYGNSLERLLSTGLVSSVGSAPEITVRASQKEIYENDRLYVKCLVTSHMPVNITFNHNGRAIKRIFSNQSNELELSIEDVQQSHAGNYECHAVNEKGTQSQAIEIRVLTVPKVKISTNWQEMRENMRYSLRCIVDGAKERRFDTLWLDESDNVLQSGGSVYNFVASVDLDGKTIKCRIQSSDFFNEDSITLNIDYAPRFLHTQNASSAITFGSTLNLDCETSESPSRDAIKWFFTPMHHKAPPQQIAHDNSSVYKLKVFEEGLFQCHVSNKIGSVKREFNVSHIVPKEPPKIADHNDVVIVNESESIELVCECNSCLPIENFTWTRESLSLPAGYFVSNVQENSFRSVVKINNVSEADGGTFECKIFNELGHDGSLIELLVQTAPKIEAILVNGESMTDVFELIDIVEGESLTLECIVDAFPEPKIVWAKNEVTVSDEASLIIETVSVDDGGVYECKSQNSLGAIATNVSLNVNYAPRRGKRSIDTDLEFSEKSRVILHCDLVGNPRPAVAWFKNSKQIAAANAKYESSNEILQFTAEADDNGMYECKGVNKHGSASINFTIIILTAPKLLQPDDEVVEVMRDESLKLSCEAVGYPLPQIRLVKDNIILSQESVYELKYASFNMSGALHCIAENRVGSAEKIFYINVVEVPSITSSFENITLRGDDVKLIVCEAQGVPQPKIQWVHESGDLLSPNETLQLNSLSAKRGHVRCEAVNSHGKDIAQLRVDVINEPVKLSIANDLQTVQSIRENDDLELLCPYENYNSIAWSFNNKTLDDIEHKLIDKKLIIHNVNRLSGGQWTCVVSNAAGNASFSYDISILASPVIFASWKLNNRVSDFLFTESDIDERTLALGENLQLNCTAEGSPTPKIQWRKSADVISEGEIFRIENLQFHHSDIYTCSAENNLGAVKKFFKVDVISAPYVDSAVPLQQEYRKFIGDSILLKCTSIIANPLPLFFWFKNGEILDEESEDHLEIDRLDVTDNGIYRCLAKNRHGSAKIEFHVSMYEPAKIVDVKEEQVSQRSDERGVRLSCTGRGNPLPIVSWISNGHIVTTTSKLNIEKLFKTVTDDSIYFDGFGNGISYLDPFKIQLSKQKFYSQLTQVDSRTLKLDMVFKNREKLQSTKFNCYSFNALGRDERSVELSVSKKPFLSENHMHHSRDQEILERLPLLLSCLSEGEPAPKITWYKGGLQIYENETIKFLSGGKFLSIEETYAWHSGEYSCVARNSEGELELKFHIVILSPPRISDYTIIPSSDRNYFSDKSRASKSNGSDNESTLNVLRGADVVLECWIVGASPAAKIHWIKLNFFDSRKNEILPEEKNFLTLNAIKESANFMCYANNSIGSIQKLFFVNVQYAPEFVSADDAKEQHVSVKLHHSINFECRVKASPEAIIRWSHNSTNIARLDNNYYFTSDNQIMRIVNVNKHHEGKFECHAENSLGSVRKVFYLTVEIPVQFSPWSEWSACTTSCGPDGIQYRSRTCILLDATPSYNCSDENIQVRKCNDIPCPIDGGWGKWSKWTACPNCYEEKSQARPRQRRVRKCDSPLPAFGGLQCEGGDVDERECTVGICPIDGGWSEWSSWSACSGTCGHGMKVRKRTCNNPAPRHSGKYCDGDNLEYIECKLKACTNFGLRKSLGREDISDADESTEAYGEFVEIETKSDENGEKHKYQAIQHREIEYAPPPMGNELGGIVPKIKITLDTYKPISSEEYKQHLQRNEVDVDDEQLDEYFEPEFNHELNSYEFERQGETTTERNCGSGFTYNTRYRQCEEIDECKSRDANLCRRNERCVNTIGSYRCERIT